MNKKQLIVACVSVILLAIFLGLKTGLVWTTVVSQPGHITNSRHAALFLYGNLLFSSDSFDCPNFLCPLCGYKYQIIISILTIGGLLIYTLRNKKE